MSLENIGFGIGVILAILGPFLLLPLLYLTYRLVTLPLARLALRSDVTRGGVRAAAFLLAVLLLAGVLAVSYFPGKFEFDRVCAEFGSPRIAERVMVDGYWREPLLPFQAREILDRGPFRFIEGPAQGKTGEVVRYHLAEDGTVRMEGVEKAVSRFGVRLTTESLKGGVLITRKLIFDRSTGRELASAASLVYEGGPLSLLLGPWGMSSCPDPRTAQGSRDFKSFYHLETLVLGKTGGE